MIFRSGLTPIRKRIKRPDRAMALQRASLASAGDHSGALPENDWFRVMPYSPWGGHIYYFHEALTKA